MNRWFVYILECADGTLYTGYTCDLEKRLEKHNKGIASKYTRSRIPVKMVFYEEFPSKSEAMVAEYSIKQMDRREKLNLIESKII